MRRRVVGHVGEGGPGRLFAGEQVEGVGGAGQGADGSCWQANLGQQCSVGLGDGAVDGQPLGAGPDAGVEVDVQVIEPWARRRGLHGVKLQQQVGGPDVLAGERVGPGIAGVVGDVGPPGVIGGVAAVGVFVVAAWRARRRDHIGHADGEVFGGVGAGGSGPDDAVDGVGVTGDCPAQHVDRVAVGVGRGWGAVDAAGGDIERGVGFVVVCQLLAADLDRAGGLQAVGAEGGAVADVDDAGVGIGDGAVELEAHARQLDQHPGGYVTFIAAGVPVDEFKVVVAVCSFQCMARILPLVGLAQLMLRALCS